MLIFGHRAPVGHTSTQLPQNSQGLSSIVESMPKRDPGVEATVDDADRLYAVDVSACPHAAPAEDALVAVDLDERIGSSMAYSCCLPPANSSPFTLYS